MKKEPIEQLKDYTYNVVKWLKDNPDIKLLNFQKEKVSAVISKILNNEALDYVEPIQKRIKLNRELKFLDEYIQMIAIWITIHPIQQIPSRQEELNSKKKTGTMTRHEQWLVDINFEKNKLIEVLNKVGKLNTLTCEEEEEMIEEEKILQAKLKADRIAFETILEDINIKPNLSESNILFLIDYHRIIENLIGTMDQMEILNKEYEINLRPTGSEWYIQERDAKIKEHKNSRLQLNTSIKEYNNIAEKYGLKKFEKHLISNEYIIKINL